MKIARADLRGSGPHDQKNKKFWLGSLVFGILGGLRGFGPSPLRIEVWVFALSFETKICNKQKGHQFFGTETWTHMKNPGFAPRQIWCTNDLGYEQSQTGYEQPSANGTSYTSELLRFSYEKCHVRIVQAAVMYSVQQIQIGYSPNRHA